MHIKSDHLFLTALFVSIQYRSTYKYLNFYNYNNYTALEGMYNERKA